MTMSAVKKSTMRSVVLALALVGLAQSFQFHVGSGLGQKGRVPGLYMSAAATASSQAQVTKKSGANPPQLMEFIEPKTNVKVVLIGTMHYNPTSIRMVEDTVDELGQKGALGSVVVESCDVRWNTTSELLSTRRGKLLKPVLKSEMKAACDKAKTYGRPVVLGDQRINVTGTSLSNALKQTVVDLATPLNGGWKRFYDDVKEAADIALPSGPGYLTASSFFDPRLLIAAPVSFFKYPLSFLARNPYSTMIVFSGLFALNSFDSGSGSVLASDVTLEEQVASVAGSLLFAGLEFALLGRVLVEVLLAERNEILARNILDQCKIYSKGGTASGSGSPFPNFSTFFPGLFGNGGDRTSVSGNEIFYVPTSLPAETTKSIGGKEEEKVIVAVLGMAHCNGIVKLLKEQLV